MLSGVIDWETSLAGSLPFDFIHYLISERRESDPQPWGLMVARALAGDLFDAEAEALLNDHLAFLGLAQRTTKSAADRILGARRGAEAGPERRSLGAHVA